LNLVFGGGHALAEATRDGVEGAIFDAVQLLGRLPMRVDRVRVPDGGEALDQIA
jgi:hypothetical protein